MMVNTDKMSNKDDGDNKVNYGPPYLGPGGGDRENDCHVPFDQYTCFFCVLHCRDTGSAK